jgi:hypothetical protein
MRERLLHFQLNRNKSRCVGLSAAGALDNRAEEVENQYNEPQT